MVVPDDQSDTAGAARSPERDENADVPEEENAERKHLNSEKCYRENCRRLAFNTS